MGNGILYLCSFFGLVLMLMGVATSDKKRFRNGFWTILVAYLGLNFISLVQSGKVNSIMSSLADRFGVSPRMFAVDVFIGANLAYLLVSYFTFKKEKG